jgi:hypothetical protein
LSLDGTPVAANLFRLDPHGGLVATETSDFTAVDDYGTPDLGTWTRTDDLQLTATIVSYMYDELEELTAAMKSVAVVRFDPDFESVTGTLEVSRYRYPWTDPTDLRFAACDATPETTSVYTLSARRVCAEP